MGTCEQIGVIAGRIRVYSHLVSEMLHNRQNCRHRIRWVEYTRRSSWKEKCQYRGNPVSVLVYGSTRYRDSHLPFADDIILK